MEVWTWVVAYIVGFSLLQLLVYRYFRDRDPSVERSSPPKEGSSGIEGLERDRERSPNPEPTPDAPMQADADTDGIRCQHCGTYNEKAAKFRYCRECVTPLK
jgi:hypothetical protein